MRRRCPFLLGLLVLLLLLVAWLARAAPAGEALRARRQLRALVYLLYPLATVLVPYLFRLLCLEESRTSSTWPAYRAALAPPAIWLIGASWIGGATTPWSSASVLFGYGLCLCAAGDLLRLLSPGAGQLVPALLGFLALGSVFAGGQAVERAPDEASRARRIELLVGVNPLVIACERLDRFDLLRTTRIYGATPIGALYVYRFPRYEDSLRRYLWFAGACWLLACLLRYAARQLAVPVVRSH